MAKSVAWVAGVEAGVDGKAVLNFTSASYLALDPLGWLRHWLRRRNTRGPSPEVLSLSMPRGLAASATMLAVERRLSALVGRACVLERSALHALVDVLELVAPRGGLVVVSRDAYRLSRVAVEQAAGRGVRVAWIDRLEREAVRRVLSCHVGSAAIVCESLTLPGHLAPLCELTEIAAERAATLVVDDTQTFGLLGERRGGSSNPYGTGGGGALFFSGCHGGHIVQVASMAKALGVPIAFVAGADTLIQQIRRDGPLIWAGSPPDEIACRSALHVLDVHARQGEDRRNRLAAQVSEFERLTGFGGIGRFPIRNWYFGSAEVARRTAQQLLREGVWAACDTSPAERVTGAAIRFLLTTNHEPPVLARAAAAIARVRRQAA